jgi:hypothetical protein
MSNDQWKFAVRVQGDLQAELLRGLLEAQEIPVLLSQEGAGKAFGFTVGPLGEVEILVPEKYLAEAQAILKQYEDGSLEDRFDDAT